MRQRTVVGAGLAVLAVFAAVGLTWERQHHASNLAAALTLQLKGPGSSFSGTQTLCLPYRPSPDLTDARSLRDDLNAQAGPGAFVSLARLDPTRDVIQVYILGGANNFPLEPGVGYLLTVGRDLDYKVLGSDDPTTVLQLIGPVGPDGSGINDFCPPLGFGPQTAGELVSDIESFAGPGTVKSISRFDSAVDVFQTYVAPTPTDQGAQSQNFTLQAGQAYRIQVANPVDYVPSRR